jgi:alkanesulfonate monooxygenase SsuD/methylene tetrahydromethanopterin reductase-like flavin-dependent oxidoreductase (luciferase family)
MKAGLFCRSPYMGPAPQGWPVSGEDYSPEIAEKSMANALAQFKLADAVGFDWLTVAEHHFSPTSLTPNPMVTAGMLTQVAKNARIAIMGATIPILNPVRVAEEFAMLDTMTGGRIVAGMLRGTPNEYVTYNVNPSESRERFEEAILLIQKAWSEPRPFGWQGRFYEYRSISIWPRPVQQPHPPLYMSGSSPESGEFAARNRIGLGFAFTTVPLAAKAAAYYREKAQESGWDPTPDKFIYRLALHVADTDEQAMADVTPAGGGNRSDVSLANRAVESAVADKGYYGRDKVEQRARLQPRALQERIELGQILVGSPETVLKQIHQIHDTLGPGILDLNPAAPSYDATMKSIELFGEKVLPQIRGL